MLCISVLLLLLLHALLLTHAQTLCMDNPGLNSTTAPQTYTLLPGQYTLTANMQCHDNFARTAEYVSFTPPVSGNYYIRISSNRVGLVMEIRIGPMCEGPTLRCSRDIDRISDKVGFDSIAFVGNQTYLILMFRYVKTTSMNSVQLEVGFLGTVSLDELTYPVLLMIVVPCAIFGLALLIAIALCCRDGRVKPNQMDVAIPGSCGTSSLAKVRRLAIATWLFSILLLVTTWAVVFTSAAYFLATATLVLSIIIYRAANSDNFAETRMAKHVVWYDEKLSLCCGFLFLNLWAFIGALVFAFNPDDQRCKSSSSGALPEDTLRDAKECSVLNILYPAYAITALIGTVILIVVSALLRLTMVEMEAHYRNNSSSDVNGVPQDTFRPARDDGGVTSPRPPPPVYPQAEVDLEEYPEAELVVDYPQAEVAVDHPQAEIAQQKQKRQWGFEVLRE